MPVTAGAAARDPPLWSVPPVGHRCRRRPAIAAAAAGAAAQVRVARVDRVRRPRSPRQATASVWIGELVPRRAGRHPLELIQLLDARNRATLRLPTSALSMASATGGGAPPPAPPPPPLSAGARRAGEKLPKRFVYCASGLRHRHQRLGLAPGAAERAHVLEVGWSTKGVLRRDLPEVRAAVRDRVRVALPRPLQRRARSGAGSDRTTARPRRRRRLSALARARSRRAKPGDQRHHPPLVTAARRRWGSTARESRSCRARGPRRRTA